MNSFYLSETGECGGVLPLSAEDARHAARVLRLRAGECVYVTDPAGRRFEAVLQAVSTEECTVLLGAELPSNEAPVQLTLYQGLPKADKLETVVQKLTELGAAGVTPVRMERCVVRLDEKDGQKRCERLNKIAREAAKQCKRALAPEIAPPVTWTQALTALTRHDLILVPWEDARQTRMKDVFARRPDARSIGIVIGPEGGMSETEVERLRALHAEIITLGPRILRTETAAVASCAMAMTLWGDL